MDYADIENKFLEERKEIGKGMMAKVYLWNGYAYKCFNDNYPQDWIAYEKNIQKQICTTDLPVVQYYDSEFLNSIKMEYIEGITLADRMRKEKYKNGVEDLMTEFVKVHDVKDISLPLLYDYLKSVIPKAPVDDTVKTHALAYLEEIMNVVDEDNCLCHMDYHFLNLMYTNDSYKIIDWIGAKYGKAIFDYARTYVIMYEFAYRLSGKYRKKVNELHKYDEDIFSKAIYVMAVQRLSEYDDKKVHEIFEKLKC